MNPGSPALQSPSAPRKALAPQRYGFLLLPNFSLIALGSAVDPLRLANAVLKFKAYEFQTVGLSFDPVVSSDGIRLLPDVAMGAAGPYDAVFVVGPNPIPRRGLSDVTSWLKRLAAKGVALGGIDTGSYFLAMAGLLNGYRCTIHWEDREVLLEQFPKMGVSNHLIEIDRDRYTCSGGVSPLDMMTILLSRPPGNRQLAEEVADLLVAQRRSPDDSQHIPLKTRLARIHPKVVEAIELMQCNMEEPLTPDEISRCVGLSQRQMERLFARQLAVSPQRKYLQIRLQAARTVLLRTNRSLRDVALAHGFVAMSHFVASYRQAFGLPPMKERSARGELS